MTLQITEDLILGYETATDAASGRYSKCRVRVYEDARAAAADAPGPLVLLTELSDNPGESVVSAADVVAGTLIAHALEDNLGQALREGRDPTFVCHYPPSPFAEPSARQGRDHYELVLFESLEVSEYPAEVPPKPTGEGAALIPAVGAATFLGLNAAMVEPLIGGHRIAP